MQEEFIVRRQAESYGHAIGILLIDCRTPFIPGDVGNASTYPFPVLYKTVPDVTLTRLIDEGDKSLTEKVIDTAKKLEAYGVRAVSSDCGYMIHFQKEVSEALSIPVIMSSLIQLPMLERSIGKKQQIGIICANKSKLSDEMLEIAGLKDIGKAVVYGMEESNDFRSPILDEEPILNYTKIKKDIVKTACEMIEEHPNIGPILLECSNMPPYAHAIQKATQRPIFDFTTLIGTYYQASFRKEYCGIY